MWTKKKQKINRHWKVRLTTQTSLCTYTRLCEHIEKELHWNIMSTIYIITIKLTARGILTMHLLPRKHLFKIFLVILKRMLQNYFLGKCFIVIDNRVWIMIHDIKKLGICYQNTRLYSVKMTSQCISNVAIWVLSAIDTCSIFFSK